MRLLLIFVAFSAFAGNEEIVDPTTELRKVAETYLKAYFSGDLDRLQTLYAENAEFLDRTSEGFGPKATMNYKGRDAILKYVENLFSSSQYHDFKYEESHNFVVGDRFVTQGVLRFWLDGKSLKSSKEKVPFETVLITMLTIQDGKVVYHMDLYDFETYGKTVKAAQE